VRRDLQDKLFSDFPKLYDRKADIRSSNMGWGFECGDGWYQLIYELSEKLQPLVHKSPDVDGDYCQVTQVKEKYGTLRVYLDWYTNEIYDLLDEYERLSSLTCERCGKPGYIDHNKMWLSATCGECRHR
jgi:hypothetical protein